MSKAIIMAEYDDNLIIEGSTLIGVKDMHVGKIVIPNFVTAIADSAFENGKSILLTTIVIPNSVRRIGKSAFRKCTPMFLTNINIPDSVSIIESNTFKRYKPPTLAKVEDKGNSPLLLSSSKIIFC